MKHILGLVLPLGIGLFSAHRVLAGVDVVQHVPLSACTLNAVEGVVGMLTTGEPKKVEVGAVNQLARLMRDAGADERQYRGPIEFLETITASPKPGVLSDVAYDVIKASDRSDRVLVCVVSNNCKLPKNVGAIHANFPRRYRLRSFATNPPIRSPVPEDIPDFLILSGAKQNALEFVHEATHYSDHRRMGRWVDANERILERGGDPDALFVAHTRVVDGVREVDEGFARIFLESRAHRAEVDAVSYFDIPPDLGGDHRVGVIEKGLEDLARYGEVIEPAAVKLELNEGNFLDVGNTIRDQMEDTVRRYQGMVDALVPGGSPPPPRNLGLFAQLERAGFLEPLPTPGLAEDLEIQVIRELFGSKEFKKPLIQRRLTRSHLHPNFPRRDYDRLRAAARENGVKLYKGASIHTELKVSDSGQPYVRVSEYFDWNKTDRLIDDMRSWKELAGRIESTGVPAKQARFRAYLERARPRNQLNRMLGERASGIEGEFTKIERGLTSGDLVEQDVRNAIGTLGVAFMNAIRKSEMMKRTILRKLGRTASARLPGPLALAEAVGSTAVIPRQADEALQVVTAADETDIDRLVRFYYQLSADSDATADVILSAAHQIRGSVAAQVRRNAAGSQGARATALRALADEIEESESYLRQFFWFFGRTIEGDGTRPLMENVLKRRYDALTESGWPNPSVDGGVRSLPTPPPELPGSS